MLGSGSTIMLPFMLGLNGAMEVPLPLKGNFAKLKCHIAAGLDHWTSPALGIVVHNLVGDYVLVVEGDRVAGFHMHGSRDELIARDHVAGHCAGARSARSVEMQARTKHPI